MPHTRKTPVLSRPGDGEFGKYYARYVASVPEGDVLATLRTQGREACLLVESLTDDQATYRYEPGKWSIKQIVGHLADGERVFSYRALCIARGDKTPLPGFEQDDYVDVARFDEMDTSVLAAELAAVRAATISLFSSFNAEEAARMGTASGLPVSVRALAFMIAGHERHHLDVIRSHYLRSN